MKTFVYSEKEISALKKKDSLLGQVMDLVGPIKREVFSDAFTTLIHAIIGQLISTKAQEAIWTRFVDTFNPLTPENIIQYDLELLKSVGLTTRKAEYIKGIAEKIVNGDLDLENLNQLDDESVIVELTKLKGVGQWTAEMVLIFAFQRPNVISYKDVAILRGLKLLYNKEEISEAFFEESKKRYSPYASIASLYLWEISHGQYDLSKLSF